MKMKLKVLSSFCFWKNLALCIWCVFVSKSYLTLTECDTGYFHLHFYIHFVIRSLPHTDLHCGTLLYAYRKALTPPPTETHHIHILTANKDPKCKTRFQKYIYIKWYNQPSNQLGNIYQPTPQRSPRLHLFFWTHKHQPSLALWCLAAFYLQRSSSLVPALTSTLLPFLLSCCHFR